MSSLSFLRGVGQIHSTRTY